MYIGVDHTGDPCEFGRVLREVAEHSEVQSILVLACDANGFTPNAVDSFLTALPVPVFGGVFPAILHNDEKIDRGCIVAGLSSRAAIQVIGNLSDPEVNYEDLMDDQNVPPGMETMLIFVDGFAKRISALIDSLFYVFALDFNYIGAGAGSLTFAEKPCLFTNQGLIQDSAVIALLGAASGVGVSHGWEDVDGPFQVTESDHNVIRTLDWKPAFDVYREVVERHSQSRFTCDNFHEIARSYPFGITRIGSERIVRDPLRVGSDKSLVCVGEVPQDFYVYVLTADTESLVNAAAKALTLSEQSFPAESARRTTLFIDCVTRALSLKEQFHRELRAVYREGVDLIGALTLGEIANSRSDYLEFYNKTSVVGMLEV